MTIDLHSVVTWIVGAAALTVALSVLWKTWGKPTQRWFQNLDKVVRDNLAINGSDELLPPELRGQGTRALLIKHIVSVRASATENQVATLAAPLEARALLAQAEVVAKALLAMAAETANNKGV